MSTENFVGKFIGPNKVTNVTLLDSKTYLGNDRVSVTFEDESVKEYPLTVLDAICKDEKRDDLALLVDDRIAKTLTSIQSVMAEEELSKDECEYVMNRLPQLYNFNLERAIGISLGKKIHEMTLRDVDILLKSSEK
jgi:hypothetical protein